MRFTIGDSTQAISTPEIDCSGMNKFDDLEYECWYLFMRYCKELGIDLVIDSKYDVDWYVAKNIQETILNMIKESGIKLRFENKTEEEI